MRVGKISDAEISARYQYLYLHYQEQTAGSKGRFLSSLRVVCYQRYHTDGTDLWCGEIGKSRKNLSVIEGFSARLEVQNYGFDAAVHTGQIRAELARQGTPIGPYDAMLAGHARSAGLILVTNNVREFERVPGLRVENWVSR